MRPLVFDDLVPESLSLAAWATWPSMDDQRWHRYQTPQQNKYATRDANGVTPAAMECIRYLVAGMNQHAVDCFPDWNLDGAGMHMIRPGGWLGRHLDSDHHPIKEWTRRWSVVLCVNPEWQDEWGGGFIHDDTFSVSQFAPKFNRVIAFETTDQSYHEVLKVTGPIARCTISVFFWSMGIGSKKRATAEFCK